VFRDAAARRRLLGTGGEILAALSLATALSALLRASVDLADPSPVYLLAVAVVAIRRGTVAALAVAVAAFLTDNFLFVEPRYSFVVARPQQLATLVLLLVLGGLIGRLAGGLRDRTEEALRREREAQALYAISRILGSVDPLERALHGVVAELVARGQLARAWITETVAEGRERPIADSDPSRALPDVAGFALLRRDDAGQSASWHRIRPPLAHASTSADGVPCRVMLAAGGFELGSLWAARHRAAGMPTPEVTRLLGAAADQVAQAIQRRRLAAAAAEADVARRGDEAKSALLASVSHDLRTPLATIRAAAGTLAEAELEVTPADRARLGRAIDDEAARLNRLVTNLLDLSRIEGGAVQPELEQVSIGLAVESTLDRLAPTLAGRPVQTDVPDTLTALADPILLDQVLTNLLENVARHAGPGSAVRITATERRGRSGEIEIVVEDAGPGVPDDDLGRLFGAFSRAPKPGRRVEGSGLGLAVVQGLAAAMGATAWATRSDLGGLAIHLALLRGEPGPVRYGERVSTRR
jgi:two-component system, OmpR family, sensor histidine kinase KdpD